MRFCPVDKVLYDKEIAGEFHLDDDVQLKIQTLLDIPAFSPPAPPRRDKAEPSFLQTLVGQFHQIIIQRQAVWRREQGQKFFAQCDVDYSVWRISTVFSKASGKSAKRSSIVSGGMKKLARRKITRTFFCPSAPSRPRCTPAPRAR